MLPNLLLSTHIVATDGECLNRDVAGETKIEVALWIQEFCDTLALIYVESENAPCH